MKNKRSGRSNAHVQTILDKSVNGENDRKRLVLEQLIVEN